eukprot:4587114-Pyramimonas_sp.AAC.2
MKDLRCGRGRGCRCASGRNLARAPRSPQLCQRITQRDPQLHKGKGHREHKRIPLKKRPILPRAPKEPARFSSPGTWKISKL